MLARCKYSSFIPSSICPALSQTTAMHLKTCLLLGVSAALTSTVIAVDPTITFCEDWEATLNCETQKMELGKCKLIPDSNKKGDTGSRGQVRTITYAPLSLHLLFLSSLLSNPS